MKQIRSQVKVGRYLGFTRQTPWGMEFLHELHYRYVYDHEGD